MKIVLALPALLLACGLNASADDESWYNDSYHTSYIYSGLSGGTAAYPTTDTRGGADVGHGPVGLFGGLGFYNTGFGHYVGHGCGGGGGWGFCPEPRRNLDLWDDYCAAQAVCQHCQGDLNGIYHNTLCPHGKVRTWKRGFESRMLGNCHHGGDCDCGYGHGYGYDEGPGEWTESGMMDSEMIDERVLTEQPLTEEPLDNDPPPVPPVDMEEDTSDVYLEGAGLDGAEELYDELLGDPSSD